MNLMLLDLAFVVVVVGGAVVWLGARFRSPKPPACHQGAPLSQRGGAQRSGAAEGDGGEVILGASLQKGLQRAQARRRQR